MKNSRSLSIKRPRIVVGEVGPGSEAEDAVGDRSRGPRMTRSGTPRHSGSERLEIKERPPICYKCVVKREIVISNTTGVKRKLVSFLEIKGTFTGHKSEKYFFVHDL